MLARIKVPAHGALVVTLSVRVYFAFSPMKPWITEALFVVCVTLLHKISEIQSKSYLVLYYFLISLFIFVTAAFPSWSCHSSEPRFHPAVTSASRSFRTNDHSSLTVEFRSFVWSSPPRPKNVVRSVSAWNDKRYQGGKWSVFNVVLLN